ncbi:hypothetical protein BIFDEN_02025 [Bifidobacterium dentium ATCC 27678]|nr:hypothetical protein BIFDEN_02025 [Bifidobacterium dentium ATCC 27678]
MCSPVKCADRMDRSIIVNYDVVSVTVRVRACARTSRIFARR